MRVEQAAERIVDLVRHAGGEAPETGQPLLLGKPGVKRLALRDRRGQPVERRERPLVVAAAARHDCVRDRRHLAAVAALEMVGQTTAWAASCGATMSHAAPASSNVSATLVRIRVHSTCAPLGQQRARCRERHRCCRCARFSYSTSRRTKALLASSATAILPSCRRRLEVARRHADLGGNADRVGRGDDEAVRAGHDRSRPA